LLTTDQFVQTLRDYKRNADKRFCFILGAGASVESGIDSGATLARRWYNELPDHHSADGIAEWKNKIKFREEDIPYYYSEIFSFRFSVDRDNGIDAINEVIEKGRPGFGYSILARVLETSSTILL
jgi:protein O-mannosyl-transferase